MTVITKHLIAKQSRSSPIVRALRSSLISVVKWRTCKFAQLRGFDPLLLYVSLQCVCACVHVSVCVCACAHFEITFDIGDTVVSSQGHNVRIKGKKKKAIEVAEKRS